MYIVFHCLKALFLSGDVLIKVHTQTFSRTGKMSMVICGLLIVEMSSGVIDLFLSPLMLFVQDLGLIVIVRLMTFHKITCL